MPGELSQAHRADHETLSAETDRTVVRDREMLKLYLADRDVPCPGCKYNLRGLRDERCPECNSDLAIAVGLVEPKQAAFLAGAVALGAGVGFHAMILVWLVWIKTVNRAGPPTDEAWPLPIGLVLCGGGLWWWLRARRRIRLMKPRVRWTFVGLCAALTAGSAVLFFAVVN